MRLWKILALVFAVNVLTVLPAAAQDAAPNLLLILDASGSMWGQIEGENKIVIARRVLKDLLADLDERSEVGLVAYGHRREGDCQDVETIVPLAALDRAVLAQTIDAINPKGKTPITHAVEQAVEVVRPRDAATTIILVSDGLETCDGDPCKAVHAARQAGVDFVLHVVGFDIGEGDISQLECAAQAGGGLYFDARNAAELSAALEQVVQAPTEVPDGRLSIKAMANGELVDVSLRVRRADTGEEIAAGRTYTSETTNPRIVPLPDGVYTVEIGAVSMRGDIKRRFEGIEIVDGSTVEKVVDFSTGVLMVKVTRNGALSDATVRVLRTGTKEQVAAGRTYRSESSNPRRFEMTAGIYDVEIGSVEIADSQREMLTGVTVKGNEQVELSHVLESGELRVGARYGTDLIDVLVRVLDPQTGKQVAGRRTSTSPKSNPHTWQLRPGTYRVEVDAFKLEGKPQQHFEVTLAAGESIEKMVDFASSADNP